jgi:tetratricopeptide (TPR) repeat protein
MWWLVASFLSCGDPPPEAPEAPPSDVREAPVAKLAWQPAPTEAAAPPVSLTSTDGTGLRLVSLEARSVVQDPLAFTELRLVFDNPQDREVEGRFAITLPSGAAVSRFAMKIGDRWQEGEVLERKQAEQVYEDFLHRRQDPALLEKNAGNEFRARVFPIPAKGRKELVISYSQELSDRSPWRLPLRGLPHLDRLDVSVFVEGFGGAREVLSERQEGFVPDRDLQLTLETGPAVGLRHEDLVAVRIEPRLDLPEQPVRGLTVLLDTSASRALGFRAQVDRVGDVLAALGDVPARVVLFDQEVVEAWSGPANGFDADARRKIVERGALGASDLAGALAWVAAHPAHDRVLVVSDGVATAGETDSHALRDVVEALEPAGVTRVDVLADGGLRDAALLSELATALPHAGVVLDASSAPDSVVARLGGATAPAIEVHVPGAAWVWPDTLRGVQSGDDALVYASLPAGNPLVVELDGARVDGPIGWAEVDGPLVERAVAQADIARLTHLQAVTEDDSRQRELVDEIVAKSVKHRVLSDWTALLVLETEEDYARYGIDRAALADVIEVSDAGALRVVDRKDIVVGGGGGGEDSRREELLVARDPTVPPEPDAAPPPPPPPPPPEPPARIGTRSDDASFIGDPGVRTEDLLGRKEEPEPEAALEIVRGGRKTTERMPGDERPRAQNDSVFDDGGRGITVEDLLGIREESAATRDGRVHAGEGRIDLDRGDPHELRQAIRRNAAQLVACYEERLRVEPRLEGRIELDWTVTAGRVSDVVVREDGTGDRRLADCVAAEVRSLRFAQNATGDVSWPFEFSLGSRRRYATPEEGGPAADWDVVAWTGPFAAVMDAIAAGKGEDALLQARAWREESPGDELALLALGEALEALDRDAEAARAYGSLIDLFPSRADIRRMAGERMERVGAYALVSDTYARAVEQRPDHPSGRHLLAMSLVREERWEEAFEVLEEAVGLTFELRFHSERILREDLGLVAAAWKRAEPGRAEEIARRLTAVGVGLEDRPSTRFVLVWETDANDVDFHVHDAAGGHAYFRALVLRSGGRLYDDVTQGYGPECFAIPGTPNAGPYTLQAHYYRRGPMGYGMGLLQVIRHDGKGNLTIEPRPFVVMVDQAYVDLGVVK